ncbi:hypothetical protein VTO42DRAFT_545 [Malbranchea cinnamomea]
MYLMEVFDLATSPNDKTVDVTSLVTGVELEIDCWPNGVSSNRAYERTSVSRGALETAGYMEFETGKPFKLKSY